MSNPKHAGEPNPLPEDVARSIARAVRGLEYGSVEIIVHNSNVVQIERHERIRLQVPAARAGDPVVGGNGANA